MKRLSCLVLSCADKSVEEELIEVNEVKNETVVNGKFYFSSKESLIKSIKALQKKSDSELEKKFESIYDKNFVSKKPIVNINNDGLISKLSAKMLLKKKYLTKKEGDSVEVEDGVVIADPLFAALVNIDNEIMVGDSIYKITERMGVLSVKMKDSTYLKDFIESDRYLNGSVNTVGYSKVDNLITAYISPKVEVANNGISEVNETTASELYGSKYGIPLNKLTARTLDNPEVQARVDALPIDNPGDTSDFQSLFGTNKSTIKYYDSKHRLKTEFWNQSWGVYTSLGVQARTQRKRLGIWWASDADEMYLGVNTVYLRYKYPATKLSYADTYYSNPEIPVYLDANSFKVLNSNGVYGTIPFLKPDNSLPFFNLGDKNILNIYIRQLPFAEKFNITDESNVKQLYKLGIDYMKRKFGNANTLGKDFSVVYQKSNEEVEVLYFGENYYNENNNQIKRTFYKDTEFLIGIVYSSDGSPSNNSSTGGGGWSTPSLEKPWKSNIREYTHIEMDFYALGRRGGTWVGSRIKL